MNPHSMQTPSLNTLAQEAGSQTRLAFIRKTYALFFTGILSTAAGAAVALYTGSGTAVVDKAGNLRGVIPPIVHLVSQHMIISFLMFLGLYFAAFGLRHKPVVNMVALLVFTFFTGLYLAPMLFVAQLYGAAGKALSVNPVRDAFLLTTAAFGGLTLYTAVSRRNFSALGGFLSMGSLVFLGAILLNLFMQSSVFSLAIASVGILLFGLYVLYDTYRILRTDEIDSPIEAALHLFLDFVNIFVSILRIFMSRND